MIVNKYNCLVFCIYLQCKLFCRYFCTSPVINLIILSKPHPRKSSCNTLPWTDTGLVSVSVAGMSEYFPPPSPGLPLTTPLKRTKIGRCSSRSPTGSRLHALMHKFHPPQFLPLRTRNGNGRPAPAPPEGGADQPSATGRCHAARTASIIRQTLVSLRHSGRRGDRSGEQAGRPAAGRQEARRAWRQNAYEESRGPELPAAAIDG